MCGPLCRAASVRACTRSVDGGRRGEQPARGPGKSRLRAGGEEVGAVTTFFAALYYILHVYLVIILARVVVETTRQFARSWRPVGIAAISLEVVYISTDPPIKLLRKF